MILTATARRKGAKRHIVARGDMEELRRIAKNVNKKVSHGDLFRRLEGGGGMQLVAEMYRDDIVKLRGALSCTSGILVDSTMRKNMEGYSRPYTGRDRG